MLITLLEIHIELFEANGLKYRRKITNSIKDRLKKSNISILDNSTEYAKEIELAVIYLSANTDIKEKTKKSINDILEKGSFEYDYTVYENII